MGLFKKEKPFDYFDAFSAIAHYGTEAACYLHQSLTEYNIDTFRERADAMHVIENAADTEKHAIIEHLAHEFITPIEREDIVALAQALDNVMDAIDDVMRRVYMFSVQRIRPETLKFTALIVEACKALEATVAEFKNFKSSKSISGLIIEVNTDENRGDALHFEYLHKLFAGDNTDRTVVIWMSLFETLEECFDACEDAADIIESVIMKNT